MSLTEKPQVLTSDSNLDTQDFDSLPQIPPFSSMSMDENICQLNNNTDWEMESATNINENKIDNPSKSGDRLGITTQTSTQSSPPNTTTPIPNNDAESDGSQLNLSERVASPEHDSSAMALLFENGQFPISDLYVVDIEAVDGLLVEIAVIEVYTTARDCRNVFHAFIDPFSYPKQYRCSDQELEPHFTDATQRRWVTCNGLDANRLVPILRTLLFNKYITAFDTELLATVLRNDFWGISFNRCQSVCFTVCRAVNNVAVCSIEEALKAVGAGDVRILSGNSAFDRTEVATFILLQTWALLETRAIGTNKSPKRTILKYFKSPKT